MSNVRFEATLVPPFISAQLRPQSWARCQLAQGHLPGTRSNLYLFSILHRAYTRLLMDTHLVRDIYGHTPPLEIVRGVMEFQYVSVSVFMTLV
jgi:hypothetical protein